MTADTEAEAEAEEEREEAEREEEEGRQEAKQLATVCVERGEESDETSNIHEGILHRNETPYNRKQVVL